jgi:polysaccharide export outer membrane protein
VLNAVALAGGYTYRAKKNNIVIKRGSKEFTASENTIVLPGDILTVPERLF